MEINAELIITAIAKKIHSIFGDSYNIETDEVKQGYNTPCFFIKLYNNERKHYRGNRYKINLNFRILGFAENDSTKQLNEMGEKLYEIEYLTLDNLDVIRCLNMNYKTDDANLQFFFDINTFIYINPANMNNEMETLSVKEGINNA